MRGYSNQSLINGSPLKMNCIRVEELTKKIRLVRLAIIKNSYIEPLGKEVVCSIIATD